MHDLGTLAGYSNSRAFAINDNGHVVGYARNGTDYRAILDNGAYVVDLNTLIDPKSGWFLEAAYGINDSDQIVGTGVDSAGRIRAYLLTPALCANMYETASPV